MPVPRWQKLLPGPPHFSGPFRAEYNGPVKAGNGALYDPHSRCSTPAKAATHGPRNDLPSRPARPSVAGLLSRFAASGIGTTLEEHPHHELQSDLPLPRRPGRLVAGGGRLGRAHRAAALRGARAAARRGRGAVAFGRSPRRLARAPRRDQCQEPPADGRHRAAAGGLSQEAGLPSLDRRARGQVDARRHAGLGLYGRPRPAREARPRRRRSDPRAGARRLPRHLRCPGNASGSTTAPTGTSGRTSTISWACSPITSTRATNRRWRPAARWATC